MQRRVVFPLLKEIRLKKWEICNVCEICKNWFVCRHRDTRWCSQACYRKTEQYIKSERNRPKYMSPETRKRRKEYWQSPAGRASFRRVGTRMELRRSLEKLGLVDSIQPNQSFKSLYKTLIEMVYKDKPKAKELLKGGKPDCHKTLVEFKVGIDFLRGNQLVFDILNGRKGKVRWLPSWDSLELTLEKKKKDKSILFSSYLSYLKWCEKPYKQQSKSA